MRKLGVPEIGSTQWKGSDDRILRLCVDALWYMS